MCKETDGSDIPSFPAMPWYFWVMIYTILFFIGPIQSILNFFMSHDRNILHTGAPLTKRKLGAAARDINIPKCKEMAKKNGVGVNDVMTAFLSGGLHRYYKRNGKKPVTYQDGYLSSLGPFAKLFQNYQGPIPDAITVGLPMSLRPPQNEISPSTVRFSNKIALMPI